ncbi:MAG TPA: L-threonylcarbamoyladenylate synthase [Candidatus Acidoferrales bacterium]|nr:L-threonylcarbamoyladenylate synthase [Candidatus Acidoferrales bacterium]
MTARRVADGPAGREEAIRVLRDGGIVAVPTDTVYGLAAWLETPGGIERLFEAKGRSADRAIAVLLADAAQAETLAVLTPAARRLAEAFWPGGLTLVLAQRPDRPALPAALTGGRPTIGLRVPDHPAPRALAAALGPLPTTSANVSGEPEARDANEIKARLGAALDLILDGGPAAGGAPSTVVDVSGQEPRILRIGAIASEAIESCLRDMGR